MAPARRPARVATDVRQLSAGARMSTVLDSKIPPRVIATLAKYGKTVTFVEEATDGGDPATGIVTVTSTTSHSVKASPPYAFERRLIDGDLIQADDQRMLIDATLLD